MRAVWCIVLFLSSLAILSPALAQSEVLYEFELEGPTNGKIEAPYVNQVVVPLLFRDLSRDSALGFVPDSPTDIPIGAHRVSWVISPLSEESEGWVVAPPTSFTSVAGDEKAIDLRVTPTATVVDPYFRVAITAVIETDGGSFNRTIALLFFTPGVVAFQVNSVGGLDLAPGETQVAQLRVATIASLPQTIHFSISENPCELKVAPPTSVTVPGKGVTLTSYSVQGPEERFWYNSASCFLVLEAYSLENPSRIVTAFVGVDVNGFWVAPEWIMRAIGLAIAGFVVWMVAKNVKERREEEILGKPEKPWTIPAEVVYLKHLKLKDERAYRVVRHYLMEEEYHSALSWYKHMRNATKGKRTKMRLVLHQEHAYERWQNRWEARLLKPDRRVEVHAKRLQKQIDREQKKEYQSALRKHEKLVAQMKQGAEKSHAKAMEKWQKVEAKAAKKGKPVPPQPMLKEPDYPSPPVQKSVLLAHHKLNKKQTKLRAKMKKLKGDLEVKYENRDAKRLEKIRRKVQRVAAKLDDPQFAAEHPLLAE